MATPNFDALVVKVRNWANRDDTVLTDSLITDFLDYSADYCYRKLRIPPLEYTYQYPTITSSTAGETSLQLPPDFSELITFSVIDSNGDRYTFNKQLVEKEFNNKLTTKPLYSFTYKGSEINFYPEAKEGDVYELYYYHRLNDLDATYLVNETNVNLGNCTEVLSTVSGAIEFPSGSGTYYIGNEVYNWLRDSNERVLLWGAFANVLDYLGEDERAMKYYQKQELAIDELNREEIIRKTKGAINTVTFEVSELL
jgi:hypothetical protein